MPERGPRTLKDIIIKDAGAEAIEARANAVVERANPETTLAVIEELENEVRTMAIASRFRSTGKIGDHIGSHEDAFVRSLVNPVNSDLSEAEFKRKQLLSDLEARKREILVAVGKLRDVVTDIEATKTEG